MIMKIDKWMEYFILLLLFLFIHFITFSPHSQGLKKNATRFLNLPPLNPQPPPGTHADNRAAFVLHVYALVERGGEGEGEDCTFPGEDGQRVPFGRSE